MTKHEIEILNVMRSRGKTAMDIALTLQISVNTVRSYIRRHPPEDAVRVECRQCGKPILQVKGRKAKCHCHHADGGVYPYSRKKDRLAKSHRGEHPAE